MKKADIGFVATMFTVQMPFSASIWILSGYIILGKIFRKFKVWA